MKTYQDLLEVGENEAARMEFVLAVISQHQSSKEYKTAENALKYYERENPTIAKYEKIIYDMKGLAHKDMYTANHKISSSFFQMNVDQQVSYLLGNGVTFGEDSTKEKLGPNFDGIITRVATMAQWGGWSWGFWNLDHIEPFSILEFAPLLDEETGALMAGVRFWQLDDDKPLRATLYEPDGYTEYIRQKNSDMQIKQEKRAYKLIVRQSEVGGTEILNGENYDGFPIVPLRMGRTGQSELIGRQNTIDALDLVDSGMINNVDEGSLIYWVLKGVGGMDDIDDAKFIERLKTIHVAHTDDGVEAEAHSIEAPFEGTQNAHDMLIKKLYTDFQAFDASAVSAGNQTATAIRACYVPLDLKTDKFEVAVTDFILGILKLAGIDDKPSYTRNQIINSQEETQTVLLGAQYFDDEYITKKLLTILGDSDQYEDMMKRRLAEESTRFENPPVEKVEEDENGYGGNAE